MLSFLSDSLYILDVKSDQFVFLIQILYQVIDFSLFDTIFCDVREVRSVFKLQKGNEVPMH